MLLLSLAACANALAGQLPRLPEAAVAPRLHTGTTTFGDSGLVSHAVTGVSLPLHLVAADHSLGTAQLIGGMDNAMTSGTAVGGLTWQAGGSDGLGAGFDVLHSASPTASDAALLTQANLRLPLPFLKSAPSLDLALGSYAGDTDRSGGDAGRLSFATDTLGGRYSLSYAHAQSGFQPQGSRLVADQAGLDLGARYALGRYQLHQRLRLQQLSPGQPGEVRSWRSDTSWSGPVDGLLPLMTTFRLHAGLRFRRRLDGRLGNTGWLLEAQGKGVDWRAWQFDTGLALGRTAACTPVGHAAWRLGGARPFRFGNFSGSMATHFGVTMRNITQTRWQVGSSLNLKMHHRAQQLSFGVRWISHEWQGNAVEEPSWRVMLNYSIAATEALPQLALAIGQLVPGM